MSVLAVSCKTHENKCDEESKDQSRNVKNPLDPLIYLLAQLSNNEFALH